MADQAKKKQLAAIEALKYLPKDQYIGIGTGSTVNFFIEALSDFKDQIKGAVTTSQQSTSLLKQHGIEVFDLNEVNRLPVYFDGADEVNSLLQMIKGGGGALLAEKIVASASDNFVCIVDDSKLVNKLGDFPVPIEVLPYARSVVSTEIVRLGGTPNLRIGYETERGNQIIDVSGLDISQPVSLEKEINHIPGVVENGIFARHPANILVIGNESAATVKTLGGIY